MYVPANPYPLLLNSVCVLGSKHLQTSARAPVNPPLPSRKMEFPDFSKMDSNAVRIGRRQGPFTQYQTIRFAKNASDGTLVLRYLDPCLLLSLDL